MAGSPNLGDWLRLLLLTAFWGTAFMFTELALRSFSPSALVFGRILIAAVVVTGFLYAAGTRLPREGRAWWQMLVMAVTGNVLPFHLITWGQLSVPSSLAGVLMAVMPLFVLTLSHFFVPGARLSGYRVLGFLTGFVGVVVVIGPDALQGLRGNASLLGALAVLGGALSYAVSAVYARLIGATDPVRLAAGMLIVGSLLSLPPAVVTMPQLVVPGLAAVVSLAVLGLFSTGYATVIYFRLVQGPGPNFLSFVNYLVPAWAVLAGAAVLGEVITLNVYAGLALILAGIAASELGGQFGDRRRGPPAGMPGAPATGSGQDR
jgi:drug/metabolite transporter (DMT)-like permease